jgi:hypothetical protein
MQVGMSRCDFPAHVPVGGSFKTRRANHINTLRRWYAARTAQGTSGKRTFLGK